MASCGEAISAACHLPKGEEEILQKRYNGVYFKVWVRGLDLGRIMIRALGTVR